jgi:hypothetical protein
MERSGIRGMISGISRITAWGLHGPGQPLDPGYARKKVSPSPGDWFVRLTPDSWGMIAGFPG